MTDFAWEATVEDVAALLPQRTKGEWGKDGGFDEETTPTASQVQNLLDKAKARIAGKLNLKDGEDICPTGPIDLAKEVHALRAAMMVELTFFMNQLRTDQSPYEKIKEQYDEGLSDLVTDYENECGEGSGALGGEKMPSGNFPRGNRWGRIRF
jgi:hypothetical protein